MTCSSAGQNARTQRRILVSVWTEMTMAMRRLLVEGLSLSSIRWIWLTRTPAVQTAARKEGRIPATAQIMVTCTWATQETSLEIRNFPVGKIAEMSRVVGFCLCEFVLWILLVSVNVVYVVSSWILPLRLLAGRLQEVRSCLFEYGICLCHCFL